ncbi:fibronectin type III domain-containing protein [Jannaschia sp. R86511]|uniref:fibronectin type III domain-containing protein n=1 Tax=Jannaschia sp. R86511 TaxID=3093853 RepID=UPI0036D42DC1
MSLEPRRPRPWSRPVAVVAALLVLAPTGATGAAAVTDQAPPSTGPAVVLAAGTVDEQPAAGPGTATPPADGPEAVDPTGAPEARPTPTEPPSDLPTDTEADRPGTAPTDGPTDGPTAAPTDATATTTPGVGPSSNPTGTPTDTTTDPTTDPTTEPTTEPASAPTGTPDAATPHATDAAAEEVLACVSDGPTAVEATLVRHEVVQVTWQAPVNHCGPEVLGYEVQLDGVADTAFIWTGENGWQLGGVTVGEHTVTVVALTELGRSQPTSTTVTMPEPGQTWPAAPQAVTLVQTGPGQVTLTWAAPDRSGTSEVTGYDVGVGQRGWGNGFTYSPSTFSAVHGDLLVGHEYLLSVAATNDAGTGPRVVLTVEVTSGQHPSVPRQVAVAQRGPGTVEVVWDEPADAGSHPVLGYRVEVGPAGGGPTTTSSRGAGRTQAAAGTGVSVVERPADARRATMSGLAPGVHDVRVSARNAAGSSVVATTRVTVLDQVVVPDEPTGTPVADNPVADPAAVGPVTARPVGRTDATERAGTPRPPATLARTGADGGVLALGALVLVGLGAGLLAGSRRRSVSRG